MGELLIHFLFASSIAFIVYRLGYEYGYKKGKDEISKHGCSMENNVEIVCKDGVLTEEHLFALKVGESLELTDVTEMRFKNCYPTTKPYTDE